MGELLVNLHGICDGDISVSDFHIGDVYLSLPESLSDVGTSEIMFGDFVCDRVATLVLCDLLNTVKLDVVLGPLCPRRGLP